MNTQTHPGAGANSPHPIRIRAAHAGDTDAVVELVSLIDLHLPASEVPQALAPMRGVLAAEHSQPLTHGCNLILIAETQDGQPVGAITCGPPLWIAHHPRIPRFMTTMLLRRISAVHGLAVQPSHRGQGIARNLLRTAELALTRADYTILTLRHDRDLKTYYAPLGYSSADRLVIDLPPIGPITLKEQDWDFAVKPLSLQVSFTARAGFRTPVVTGALTQA
ncbi:GNAT family N-acetyltransferase [Streptomyces sp. NPDC059991]|uniref:GNAT family N-acetyltransferase n=1 Tax=Streptomyces sp. NPDC059991 TaxID=3347028 RepID=UPI0036C7F060